jgi:uracil-DNA glycosylase
VASSGVGDSRVSFVADLAVATIGGTFNQYASDDPLLDQLGGSAVRAGNLIRYLSERPRPRLMLVGEAPSYRGCCFSGLAFTSERSMPTRSWSSTNPKGWQEPSATIVHRALGDLGLDADTLLWNACPTHPAGATPLSNRLPTARKLQQGHEWLERLIELTQPTMIVAVGQSARRSLAGHPVIRHPAHGGASEFIAGLRPLLSDPTSARGEGSGPNP